MTQLKKALERSDAYIEELESQVSKLQSGPLSPSTSSERRRDGAVDGRSPNPDNASIDPSDSHDFLGIPPSDETSAPQKDTLVNFAVPSTPPTPSSALGRLSLKSPVVRSEKKPGCNRLPYLRRLSFDDCGTSSSFTAFSSVENTSAEVSGNLLEQKTTVNPSGPSVWSRWEGPCSGTFHSARDNEQKVSEGVSLADEARMDAAFLDIVSELDSMMAEGESSRSHTPRLLPDFGVASLSDPVAHVEPESSGEQQHSAEDPPETCESVKRKYPVSLATPSPSKLSRMK